MYVCRGKSSTTLYWDKNWVLLNVYLPSSGSTKYIIKCNRNHRNTFIIIFTSCNYNEKQLTHLLNVFYRWKFRLSLMESIMWRQPLLVVMWCIIVFRYCVDTQGSVYSVWICVDNVKTIYTVSTQTTSPRCGVLWCCVYRYCVDTQISV